MKVYANINNRNGKFSYGFQTTTRTPFVAGEFRRLTDNETGISTWHYFAAEFQPQPSYERIMALAPRN